MTASSDAARLTVRLREPASGQASAQARATDIVARAYAAGMVSATVHRGVRPTAVDGEIPAPRSLSLADEEGTTVVITGPEERLCAFAAELDDLASGGAHVVISVGERSYELDRHGGPALSR